MLGGFKTSHAVESKNVNGKKNVRRKKKKYRNDVNETEKARGEVCALFSARFTPVFPNHIMYLLSLLTLDALSFLACMAKA